MAVGVQSGSVQSRAWGSRRPLGSRRSSQRRKTMGSSGWYQRAVPVAAWRRFLVPSGQRWHRAVQTVAGVGQHGLTGAHDPWPPPLSRFAGRGRIMEDGIQAQPGQEGDGRGHGLAGGQQLQGGVGPVADDHQLRSGSQRRRRHSIRRAQSVIVLWRRPRAS